MTRLLCAFLFAVSLVGCDGGNNGSVDWVQELPPTPTVVFTMDGVTEFDTIDPAPFELKCIADCVAPYHITGKYEEDIIRLNFHFAPHFPHSGEDVTLADFHDNFDRFYLRLIWPEVIDRDEAGNERWRESISFQHSSPVTILGEETIVRNTNGIRVDLTSYEDGLLTGSVEGVITLISHLYDIGGNHLDLPFSDVCQMGDIIDMCFEDENVYLPFSIEFILPVQLPAGAPTSLNSSQG